MNPENIEKLKEVFQEFKIRPNPRLGQNFLTDQSVLEILVTAGDLGVSDRVVEIGAGTGSLTVMIGAKAGQIEALEVDPLLVPLLDVATKDLKNLSVWLGDALDFDYDIFFSGIDSANRKVIGSIPYQITSPLLHRLIVLKNKPSLIVWLVQKEVAEKMVAQPPDATYLSNLINFVGKAEIVRNNVRPSSFWPQPKVESAIIKIIPNRKASAEEARKFSEFLHKAFSQTRKMLYKIFDKGSLEKAGIDSRQRAQEVEPKEWLRLFTLEA